MKRHFTILASILGVAMCFTACQKDKNDLVTLNVEIGNYNGNAKMYVDSERYTHWTTGDQVNINGKSTTCTVDLSGDKAKITNVPESNAGYLAVYPAGIASYFGTYSSTSFDVTLPSSQTYSVDGSGNQIIKAPMYGYCANGSNTLTFHNLCSLLKVTVNNDRTEDITMQSITVTSSSGKLSGAGTIYGVKTDSPYLTMGSEATSYDYVTLDFSGGTYTVSQGTSKDYYIALPAFATSNITISIVATTAGGTLELDRTASEATLAANGIVQGPTLALDGVAYVGTEQNPYKINDLDDLIAFRTRVNGGTTYEGLFIKLMANIDCGASWTPIGTVSNNFKGTFDGNSKTITYVIPSTSTGYLGLFGYTQNATIKNLNVNATITSSNGSIGGVVARSEGGTVMGCTATGNISGYNYIGGIVGRNYGSNKSTVSSCSSSVNVTSTKDGLNYIGGIMGYFYTAGEITGCSASGEIYAPEANGTYVGGIAGNSTGSSSITGCDFTGKVRGSGYVGMILGSKANNTTISGCTYSAANAGSTYKGVGASGTQTGNDTGCTAQ